MISLADLKSQYRTIKEEIDSAIGQVTHSGQFVNGPQKAKFEAAFADYLGIDHAVGVNNGTDAIALALMALSIGPGDEVIVPANSFRATAEAVVMAGGQPVFCDISHETLMAQASHFEAALTPKTKAIVPVHLYGYPAPIGPILDFAKANNLFVVEDSAQAHGTQIDGACTGTFGQAGAFSFFPGKVLGAFGDAGIVTTNDPELADRIRMIGNHGRGTGSETIGRNSRLDEIQSAVLLVKLKHLPKWAALRKKNENTLRDALAGIGDLQFLSTEKSAEPVPLNVLIRSQKRDALKAHLLENGVLAGIHYDTPIHLLEGYRSLGYRPKDFPNAEKSCAQVLSLPNHPDLTDEDIAQVIKGVVSFFD